MSLDSISRDCFIKILEQAEPQDYFCCRRVCKLFKEIISNETKMSRQKSALFYVTKKIEDINEGLIPRIITICTFSSLLPNTDRERSIRLACDLSLTISEPELKIQAYCALIPHLNSPIKRFEESFALWKSLKDDLKKKSLPQIIDGVPHVLSQLTAETLLEILRQAATHSCSFPTHLLVNAVKAILNADSNKFPLLLALMVANRPLQPGFNCAITHAFFLASPKDKHHAVDLLKAGIHCLEEISSEYRHPIALNLLNILVKNLFNTALEDLSAYKTLLDAQVETKHFFLSIEQQKIAGSLLKYIFRDKDLHLLEVLRETLAVCKYMLPVYPRGVAALLENSFDFLVFDHTEDFTKWFQELFYYTSKVAIAFPEKAELLIKKSWHLVGGIPTRSLHEDLAKATSEVMLASSPQEAIRVGLTTLKEIHQTTYWHSYKSPAVLTILLALDKNDFDLYDFYKTSTHEYDPIHTLLNHLHWDKRDALLVLLEKVVHKHQDNKEVFDIVVRNIILFYSSEGIEKVPCIIQHMDLFPDNTFLFMVSELQEVDPILTQKIFDRILRTTDSRQKFETLKSFFTKKLSFDFSHVKITELLHKQSIEARMENTFLDAISNLLNNVELEIECAIPLFNLGLSANGFLRIEETIQKYSKLYFLEMMPIIERYCSLIQDPLQRVSSYKSFLE